MLVGGSLRLVEQAMHGASTTLSRPMAGTAVQRFGNHDSGVFVMTSVRDFAS